ncbi:MAG: PKD domain-containing protein, partial [Bacteroidia bacterium]|nr:PKD domain-containing protein [Bacteroidia bacterium]
VTVTVNPLPVINVAPPPAICVGQQSATLTANGASTYLWTPSNALSATTGSSVTANPISTTTYTATGTDNNGCTASTQVTVVVNPLPVVTVSPDITICPGQSTILTAAGANTYAWTPSTGLSNTTGSAVTATPATPITYSVTGTDNNGCTASAQVTIFINSQPNVTVGPATICNGQSTTLNANGANTYAWSPATSLSSTTGYSVTANPSSTITYTVVGDLNGCTASTQVTVTVNPLPVIAVVPPPAICVGQQSATLNANGASTYSWTPSNTLSSATGSSVTANPVSTTIYTVTGTDNNGCTSSTQVTININQLPVIAVPPPPAICVGQQSATLTANGASTYLWSPSNTLSAATGSSVTANPASTTTYTITGTDNNGCTASTQVTVTVNPLPQPSFTCQVAACSRLVSFNNTSQNAVSHSWDFGDASTSQLQNPSHTYAVNGNYNVTLIAVSNFGCIDTIISPVIINYVPVNAAFNYLNTPCSYTFSFSDQSTGASNYSWDFGDALTSALQNPQHIYASSGNYNVILISSDANGCSDTSVQVVSMQPLSQSNFTYQVDTCSLNVSFTNNSLYSVNYNWDFGDASTSTLLNPAHTYSSTGNYNVTLIAATASGCTDTLVVPLPLAFTLPVAAFTFNNLPCSNAVNFNNQSSSVNNCLWNFGDTSTSTSQNPQHTYSSPGNYTVTLVANGVASCSDTTTQVVTINNLPSAAFVPIMDICFLNSAFFNSSVNSTSYFWDFGDNSTSTTQSPFHTYSQSGTYTVKLIATDSNGCTDTVSQTIVFPPLAQAAFTFHVDTCIRFATFYNNSVNGNSYYWNFGDGNNSTLQNPTHTYTFNNNYNVTLIVTGSTGCKDTLVMPVPVFFIPPVAGFTHANPVCTRSTHFNNQSSLASNYFWSFGDNTYSNLINPTHEYQQPGNYNVTLIASTPDGCADTTASPVVIATLPKANYNPVVDTCSLNASFNNSSQNATSFYWNFGDNTVSNSPNPTHTYSDGGTYTVTLIAIDGNGCRDAIVKTISLSAISQASYVFSIDTCAQLVNFFNRSDFALNYLWDFGDGQTSSSLSVSHHYSGDGNYPVLLITNPGTICADTAEHIIDYSMYGIGNVWIPNAFTPNHDGKNDIYEVVGYHPCEDLTFSILNRWGELIYQTTESHISWDGLYNGKRVEQGVYVYILEGKNTYQIGTITVMR